MEKPKRRPRRLRRRTNSIVLFLSMGGLIFGVAAVFIAMQPQQVQSKAPPKEPLAVASDYDTVLVPTPTRAVARGEALGNVPFSKVKWPKNRLTDNYILDVEQFKDAVASTPLPKYLPIPVSAVSTEPLDRNAVVEGIPEGMRAITVRVDEEAAVEGWARSGNFVDVILIRSSSSDFVGLEAKVIAENVRILSAERQAGPAEVGSRAPNAPRTVTLLTTQEDALKIKTAASIGKLNFALRGSGDETPTAATAMNQRKLLGGSQRIDTPKQFRGFAQGPDGAVYVLSDGSDRWLKTPEPPSAAPSQFSEKRAKLSEPKPTAPTEVPKETINENSDE